MGCTCSASLFLPAGQAVHLRTTTADFLFFLGEVEDDEDEDEDDEDELEEDDVTAVEPMSDDAAAAATGSAEPNNMAAVAAKAPTL